MEQLTLAKQLVSRLLTLEKKIATAESCTGGGISAAITDVAGSSSVFEYGFVTYSNKAKQDLLGVQDCTLQNYGAVSSQTVEEMAKGALTAAGADLAISISGIAGPGGGSETKPVGTVWFAIANLDNQNNQISVTTDHQCFSGDRIEVRRKSVKHALELALSKLD